MNEINKREIPSEYIKLFLDKNNNKCVRIITNNSNILIKEDKYLNLLEIALKNNNYEYFNGYIIGDIKKINSDFKALLKDFDRSKYKMLYNKENNNIKNLNVYEKGYKINKPMLSKKAKIGIIIAAIGLGAVAASVVINMGLNEGGQTDNIIETTIETPNSPNLIGIDSEDDDSFNFVYENRENEEAIINARNYIDEFIEVGQKYGIDYRLLMAIAAQESNGKHEITDDRKAIGIMQIERSQHIDTDITAHNYFTDSDETLHITDEILENAYTNINVGAMYLQKCLEMQKGNIPLAIQTYNYGPTNMKNVLIKTCEEENVSMDDLISGKSNLWVKYLDNLQKTKGEGVGDNKYFEHVLSYLGDNFDLSCIVDGKEVTQKFVNQNENIKQR